MKKGIMSVIIVAGMSVGVFAQNYNTQPTQPNYNSQPNLNPNMPYQNGTQNQNGMQNNTGSTYSTNPSNPIPGATPNVQQPVPQQTQPGTNYQLNSNNNGINNPNAGTPYDQNTARGEQNMGPQNRPNTNMNRDLNSGTPGAGDSLLRDQSRLDGPRAPFEENGYEPGFLNFNYNYDTARFYTLANMPDPPTKNRKKMSKDNSVQSTETESAEARALKEKDKTANAVPDWVKANVEAREARQRETSTCYLNNELSNRQGSFKEKSDFNGGELYMSRERDGEEKVKFNNGTEFYKYEKTEKGKERFSYGVTKDYETMELKKNDDGTAEILYHGIFPSVEDAESAIMDGIVVEEMGNVCRGVYRQE